MMDSHSMDDILKEIEHLSKDEKIDHLYNLIEKESQKSDGQINMQFIDDCNTLVNQYIGDDPQNLSATEINRIYLQHKKKRKTRCVIRTTASKNVAKRIMIAASIILLLCGTTLTAGAAIEGLSIGEYLSFVIQNLKPGEDVDKDGFSFEYLGENKQYTDIKDVLSDQNLDIMYPSVLPDGVAIEKVYLTEAFSGEEKGELIVTFNDKDISCVISNKNSVNIVPEKLEEYTTDYLVFYIQLITSKKRYQAVAQSDGMEYSISCSNYENLVTLMKGFTK